MEIDKKEVVRHILCGDAVPEERLVHFCQNPELEELLDDMFAKVKGLYNKHGQLSEDIIEKEEIPAPQAPDACRTIPAKDQSDHQQTAPLASGAENQKALPPEPSGQDDVLQPPVLSITLPNAFQGKFYDEPFQNIAGTPAALTIVDVRLDDALGLEFDSGRLKGIPVQAGEYKIHFRYRNHEVPGTKTGEAQLCVNPDPKTLWKELEPDEKLPFPKKHKASEYRQGLEKNMLAARVRGRSHANNATYCDDDFFIHYDEDSQWFILVVADGAGSAKYARRGSELAVKNAGNYLAERLSDKDGQQLVEDVISVQQAEGLEKQDNAEKNLHENLYKVLGNAVYRADSALREEAGNTKEMAHRDLATTLLAGIARKCGQKWLCAAYWVGDGAVAVYRENKEIVLLGTPDSGEYSGQTCFLDWKEIGEQKERAAFHLCEDFTAFMLMSDGVSDPKFGTEAQLRNLAPWDKLWQELKEDVQLTSKETGNKEERMLEWLNFWSQGEHDDRTIALLF